VGEEKEALGRAGVKIHEARGISVIEESKEQNSSIRKW